MVLFANYIRCSFNRMDAHSPAMMHVAIMPAQISIDNTAEPQQTNESGQLQVERSRSIVSASYMK